MASHTFEQFIRFTTDAAGLERLLRLVQAVIQIILAYPLLLNLFISLLFLPNLPDAVDSAKTETILDILRTRIALARRFFRLFRFLDNFNVAHKLYTSTFTPAPSTKDGHPQGSSSSRYAAPAELWLDILCRTFNGLYLLLETLTLVDALDIPGLAAWGPAGAAIVNTEAQRFWFLSLVCGIAAGVVRLLKASAMSMVPVAGQEREVAGDGEQDGGEWSIDAERKRLRGILEKRRAQRLAWRRNFKGVLRSVGRRIVADALDLAVPGVIVGYVRAKPGTVGVVMLGSTILTGLEVWERCGYEVARS